MNNDNASEPNVSGDINNSSNFFSEFYRNVTNENDENEISGSANHRHDFPRMKNSEIDQFKYHSTEQFNEAISVHKVSENDLKTINLNIRGLNQNYNNLTTYLSSLSTKFDIIILSECHLQKDEVLKTALHNKFPLVGYNMFYTKSTLKYGGVVAYVKESLNAVYINNLTQSNHLCDSLFLKITDKKTEIIVAGFYRFCQPQNKAAFIEFIESQLSNKII